MYRYFKNNAGNVLGYDEEDPTQETLIKAAVEAKMEEVTGAWPTAEMQAERAHAEIMTEIAAIEARQTLRMMRQAQDGDLTPFPSSDADFSGMTAAQALVSIEARVVALRKQLQQ